MHVRRLRLDYESHATALDRSEFGAILAAPASSTSGCNAGAEPPAALRRLLIGGVMRCSGRCAARSAAGRLAERQGYGVCGQVCTGWLVCMLSI